MKRLKAPAMFPIKPPSIPLARETARIELLDLYNEVREDVPNVPAVLCAYLAEHIVRESRDLALRANAVLDEGLRVAHVDLRGDRDGPLLFLRARVSRDRRLVWIATGESLIWFLPGSLLVSCP